ncbi:MAG TPA: YlxR family protein [Myxococcales bacterium]|nr:YlxR family protein [Myxococcales bacterium]
MGCRLSRPQAELLRLAAKDGEVVPDPARRIPGRGCYLCRDPRCAERAAKGGQIARALKGKAAGPPAERVLGWLRTWGRAG